MTDNRTKLQRSHNMSKIKSTNTGPEIKIKKVMKTLGFSYQPKLYGHPDFADKKRKIIVFIDGCFWHKCPKHYIAPKSNLEFWKKKIKRNVKRDRAVTKKLRNEGWIVLRIWEHQIKSL